MQLLDFAALQPLGERIRDAAVDGQITVDALVAIAEAADMPASRGVAAAVMTPDIRLVREHGTLLEVCIQGCQLGGSVQTLEALLDERARRRAANAPCFDLRARPCLDACHHGPVVASHGPMGAHRHPRITPDQVSELCDALLSE